MSKIWQVFLIASFIFLGFFIVKNVQSFGIQQEFDAMGMTCGIPDSAINKCCHLPNVKFDLKTNNDIVDVPLTIVRVPLEFLLNLLTQTIPKTIQQSTEKFMGKSIACYPDISIPSTTDWNDPSCMCVASGSSVLTSLMNLCDNISNSGEKSQCASCINSEGGIWTSIGCVYSDFGAFIEKTLLGWGIGLAGIVALLCIIYASFQMQTSQGNPEKIKKAQELLTSCIMGLMLIIFSVFILKLIGVDILRIPGFY